jgi:peptidoglycan/LPS O-acetylase OafA/YrhL
LDNSQTKTHKNFHQGTHLGNRLAFLDILRFFSAIMVGICHLFDKSPVNERVFFPLFDFQNDNWFFHNGYGGVVIFFLISGYIIPASMKNCKNFSTFILKRIIRIYPLFFLVYLYSIYRFDNFNFNQLIALILPIADFFNAPFLFDPDWTLRLEFFFYLIIGVIFYYNKLTFKSLYICIFINIFFIFYSYFNHLFLWNFKLRFMIFLFLGSLLYLLEQQNFSNNKNSLITILLFILVILIFEIFGFNYKYFHENITIGTIIFIIFYLIHQTKFQIKSNKFTKILGNITYSIYLLHYLIYKDIYYFFESHFLAIIGLFLICFLVYNFIEKPIIKFLNKKII